MKFTKLSRKEESELHREVLAKYIPTNKQQRKDVEFTLLQVLCGHWGRG